MSSTIRIEFVVEFEYYQYNSGSANNGVFTSEVSFDTIDEANEFIRKMNEDKEFRYQVINDHTAIGGVFYQILSLHKEVTTATTIDLGEQPYFAKW